MRDLNSDMEALQTVRLAGQRGDMRGAAELAEALVHDGFEHPLLLNVLALRLESEGRFGDALRLLLRAVELTPADARLRNAVGLCLLRLERPDEALLQFEAVLGLQPELAYAHTNKGSAFLAMGDLERAEQSFGRALEFEQNPVAVAGLATIATRRGAHAKARVLAEQVLRVAPGQPDAVTSAAEADLACGDTENAAQRLRELIGLQSTGPLERAYAQGLLGDVLDASGRTTDAFAAYSKCNDYLRSHYADQFIRSQSALNYVRSLTSLVNASPAVRWQFPKRQHQYQSAVREHVFLLGFPRSGTTLLELALSGHPEVATRSEQEALISAVRAYMGSPEDLNRLIDAGDRDLVEYEKAYWDNVQAGGQEIVGKVFIDKNPLNTLKLPLIARLFPDAKILLARRDPRDVVLSCFRRRFRMSAPMYEMLTLSGTADYYSAVMSFGESCLDLLPVRFLAIRHEDVVAGFETQLRETCAFLNLTWTESLMEFGPRTLASRSATPSTAQLSHGLNDAGVGSWQRYKAELSAVLPILRPWVERFGYAP